MNPSDIGAHPDAPQHYVPFGRPPGTPEEDCGTLYVRRLAATGDMLYEPAARLVVSNPPSGEGVYPCFQSEWVATEEERVQIADLLLRGEPIAVRTLLVGNGLPPMSIWLKGREEI